MAFLCPVRIKRSKKKKPLHDDPLLSSGPSLGRITGSASIETLVRVGLEKENGLAPESKMVVLHDFTPCVDDELEVKRGQIVHVLYQENDWVYVISEGGHNHEGFIPHSYCAPYGSQLAGLALNVKKKMPRDPASASAAGNGFAGPGGGGLAGPGGGGVQGNGKSTSLNGLPTATLSTAQQQQSGLGAANTLARLQQQQQQQTANRFGAGSMAGANNTVSYVNAPIASNTSSGRVEHSDSDTSSTRPHGIRAMANNSNHVNNNNNDQSRSGSWMSESSSQPESQPFLKEQQGRYIVLYSYSAQDENDVSVERGQCVTVLNADDPDWYWVARFDHVEGFVPAGFIYPLDAIQRQQGYQSAAATNHQRTGLPSQPQQPHFSSSPMVNGLSARQPMSYSGGRQPSVAPALFQPPLGSAGTSSGPSSYSTTGMNSLGVMSAAPVASSAAHVGGFDDGGLGGGAQRHAFEETQGRGGPRTEPQPQQQQKQFAGTELVMLYDYKAQAPDDLTVRTGDWVYADLSQQTVEGWLWCYAPKARKYGFIPKAYARPPAMTSL